MIQRYRPIDSGDFEPRIRALEEGLVNAGNEIINVEDWRGQGGDSSDTGTLLNAIAAAKAAGGMKLNVPARIYDLQQTLTVDDDHIWLIGQGAGWLRQGTAAVKASAQTSFLWNGPVGGTIVHFVTQPGIERRMGGGLQGIQLDGNNFRAARGLHLDAWNRGLFEDIVSYACSESCFRTSCTYYALGGSGILNVQNCTFRRCLANTAVSGSTSLAYGFHLTGGSPAGPGNTCVNHFSDCNAYMAKGIGWKIENTDDNYFFMCIGSAAFDAAQYGFELGSSDQDSTPSPAGGATCARHNTFFAAYGDIHARASQTGGDSSEHNVMIGPSRANAIKRPVLELGAGGSTNAELYYWESNGGLASKTIDILEAGLPAPSQDARYSRLYIDTVDGSGPLKLRASSGVAKTFFDDVTTIGTWTPVFSFTTPGDSVITHNLQNGYYQKLGPWVLVSMDIKFTTNAYTTAAGTAQITGLPFTSNTGGTLNVSTMDKITFTGFPRLHITTGVGTAIQLQIVASDALTTIGGPTNFPPSKTNIRLIATGIYRTAA